MKKSSWLFIFFFVNLANIQGQDYPLIPDHPGTFELIDWGVYTHWDCGFTKSETTANYQKIIGISNLVRKNPVFTDQKGFNCYAYVFAENCPGKFGYGIPGKIRFDFGDWFMDKGQPKFYKIEPPSWSIFANTLEHTFGPNYSLGAPKPTEKPKEGFNYEKWKSVSDKLHDIIYLPGQKEELGNGIDRYSSEQIVVYNPERPPYYLPVKFRVLAELLIEYWKLHPDKFEADLMLGMMEAEYAKFSETERDSWAYNNTYDERSPFLKITNITGPQLVVRLNPEYWNKKLSRSAIQLLVFNRLTDTKRLTREKEEALKHNSTGYSLLRFEEALDIKMFSVLIDK
ncbi:MAG: hypothetical protein WCS79_11085 [Paludibacter sp.]